HKGMKITDDEFNALAGHLKDALKKNGVADADAKMVLDAVEGTRKDIVEGTKPEPEAKLWDKLGGEPAVTKVVDDFVKLAADDKEVNFFRTPEAAAAVKPEDVKALKGKLVDFISGATGGPRKYSGKSMKEAHKNM